MGLPSSRLWIFTGPIGVGKTSLCLRLIAEAQSRGWDVAGILSPGVYQEGHKVAIDAVDIRSGERRRLAWRMEGEERGVIHTQEWQFDPETLHWGNRVVETAVPCDLFVVDEIGPLELEQGAGWTAALSAIATRAYRLGVVVLRPALLALAARWSPAHVLAVRGPDQPLTLADLLEDDPLRVR